MDNPISDEDVERAKSLRNLLRQANSIEKKLTESGFDVCFDHSGGRNLGVRIDKRVKI